jgi:hypothetical protein
VFAEYANRKVKDRERQELEVERTRDRLGAQCKRPGDVGTRGMDRPWRLILHRKSGLRDGSAPATGTIGASERPSYIRRIDS